MSKFSKTSKKEVVDIRVNEKTAVTNFMGGTSYTLNPLDTLRIVAASSIFGEPSYYRGSHDKPSNLSMLLKNDVLGLYGKDLFVLVRKSSPVIQYKNQQHARKKHSYLWIFQKKLK